jgi:hypothetical protein
MKQRLLSLAFIVLLPCTGIFAQVPGPENGSIFREITQEAGITYSGTSFGHVWIDVNADGFPDMFTTGHGKPQFYMNKKDGTFRVTDIPLIREYDSITGLPYRFFDLHGATVCDVNNDGFPDLYVPIGGDGGNSTGKQNFLFLGTGDSLIFVNRAGEFNLTDSLGRGRAGLWFDQNGDGYLDMFLSNLDRNDLQFRSSLYRYNPATGKYDHEPNTGMQNTSLYHTALIRNVANTANLMVTADQRNQALEVIDVSRLPFNRVLNNLHFGLSDFAIGDFNGDGIQDIFSVSNMFVSEGVAINDTTLQALLYSSRQANGYATERRVSFRTEGKIRVESTLYPYKGEIKKYWRIGRSGRQPDTNIFELDAGDPGNQGFLNCPLCVGPHIGYNTSIGKWEIFVNDPMGNGRCAFRITSDQPITDIETHNFSNNALLAGDRLLIGQPNGGYLQKQGFLTNAPNLTKTFSVVAADFDNDMDLDLILACRGSAVNYENRYYENDGNGNFSLIPDFGAKGSQLGRSGSISTADINNDGFLDLFLENGEGVKDDDGSPLAFNDGPYQLFLNKGNSNHWIVFDISDEDSPGNKLAMGTTVLAYAGGKKQIRLKGSELHSYAQNDARIHFGLGPNEKADSVQIIWPDGYMSTFYCLRADSIYKISGKNNGPVFDEVTFDFPSVICFGDSTGVLPGISNEGITGVWNNPNVSNTASGSYTFTPHPGQCAGPVTLEIEVMPKPLLTLTGPARGCEGDTILLQASTNGSLLWSTGDTASVIKLVLTTSTHITVTASNQYGCTKILRKEIIVRKKPSTPVAVSNSPVAVGSSIVLTATSTSAGEFIWTSPNGTISSGSNLVIGNATESLSGLYTVVVNEHGCNSNEAEVMVEVVSTLQYSGKITTSSGTAIGEAVVQARGRGGRNALSLADGSYMLNLLVNNAYEIETEKEDNLTDLFVTIADIVRLERHLNGQSTLETAYEVIAADVDRSHSLNEVDVQLIKAFVAGESAAWPHGEVWTFVLADHIFPDPQHPFPYPVTRYYYGVEDAQEQDLIGIRWGNITDPAASNNPTVQLSLPDKEVGPGDQFVLPVIVSDFNQVSGWQLLLSWNPDVLEYTGWEAAANDYSPYVGASSVENGLLSVLATASPQRFLSLPDESELIHLHFTAKEVPGGTSTVEIIPGRGKTELTDQDIKLLNTYIQNATVRIFVGTSVHDTPNSIQAILIPNPFSQQSILRFELPYASSCHITVTDVSGKLISNRRFNGQPGINQVEVGHQLPAGTYLLHLRTDTGALTLKMVVVK